MAQDRDRQRLNAARHRAIQRTSKWLAIAVLVAFGSNAWAKKIDVYDLKGLIWESTQNHPSVLHLRELLRSAESDVDYSKRQYYPDVSLSAAYHESANTGSLIVKQHLWDGGTLKAGVDVANKNVDLARATVDEQTQSIAVRTLDAWRTFVLTQQKALIVDQGISRLHALRQMMQRRVDAQVSPRVELELVRARVIQLQVERDALLADRDLAVDRLAQLTGAEIDVSMPASQLMARWADLISRGWRQPTSDALKTLGDEQPSVRRSRLEASVASAEVQQREANQWPQIYLQYQQGVGTPITNEKKLVLGVSYVPGAGWSSQSLLDAALARSRAKAFASLSSLREARENIEAKVQAIRRAETLAKSWQPSVTASESLLASYQRQFVAGRKTWQEVLTQLHELNQGRQSLLDVQVTWVASQAEVELMKAATSGASRFADGWYQTHFELSEPTVDSSDKGSAAGEPAGMKPGKPF